MNSPIPIYVINLDDEVDRMQDMAARMSAINLSFERFPAYRGFDIPPRWKNEFFSCNDDNSQNIIHRSRANLGGGEIGCYASHLGCMELLIDSNAHAALVLEDDVELSPELVKVIDRLHAIPDGWDILRLSNAPASAWLSVAILTEISELARHGRIRTNAAGYCVSRQGAKKLLARTSQRDIMIDVEMQYGYMRGIVSYCVVPPPVSQVAGVASSIEANGGRSSRARMRRLLRRPLSVHRRIVFNIRMLSFSAWSRCLWRNIRIHTRRRFGRPVPAALLRVARSPRRSGR